MGRHTSQEINVFDTIALRASSPLEQQRWEHQSDAQSSEHDLQTRLQQLYTRLDAKDSEEKKGFLARYQLDEQQMMNLLSPGCGKALLERPGWIEKLECVVSEFAMNTHEGSGLSCSDRAFFSDNPVPFEELLYPFVRYARRQLLSQSTSSFSLLLSEEVQAELEHWLLESLFQWAGGALQLEFWLFRRQRSWSSPLPADKRRRDIYDAFLRQYSGKGLLSFFQEYSALARVLMLLVEQWVKACEEFVQRLQADQEEISHIFHERQPLGAVIKLRPDCSDPHHGGRSVFLLQFATGLKLVYKPRSMAMDQAFFSFLSWCHAHGLSPHLKTLQVLNRTSYGWMEYVEQVPCASPQEVRNYYMRAGMLLGLLYALGGTDIHHENLVACGEHPVLIDLEMVVGSGNHPLMISKTTASHVTQPGEIFEQTVLHSGLLPARTSSWRNKQAIDISALGGIEESPSLMTIKQWKDINTDAMSVLQSEEHMESQGTHTVMMQETPINSANYIEEMRTGFGRLYHFLLDHHRALLAPEGPLSLFEHCSLRIVLRKTETYVKELTRLKHPKFLREGCERWIDLQIFKRPLQTSLAEPRLWELAEAEMSSLEQLDVPWFGTTFESHDLQTDTGLTIKDVFPLSTREWIHSHLTHLDENDLSRQIQLIDASYLAAAATEAVLQEDLPPLEEELKAHAALSKEELLAVARQIGQELRARAFPYAQEYKSWIGFHFEPTSKCFMLQPVGSDLYEGVCGITLFLAALDYVTEERTYAPLISSALQPLCLQVREATSSASQLLQKQWDLGGTSGLGSFLYALTQIVTWLQRPELLEVARQAASLITAERVQADQSLDIIGGSAGTILGLLSLYKQVGGDELLEQALLCGHHLLEQRVETASSARSWPAFQKQSLTGFSHGAAGIAYALLLLSQATGQHAFKDAAQEAIHFEQHLFSPEAGNWPDLREVSRSPDGSPVFVTSWCHGATGIGLARLGGLPILDTPQVRNDLRVALQTTQAYGLEALDNLCCGNFGRLELLVAASQRLGQPQLLEMARQWASVLVHRASQRGGFRLLAQLPRQAYNPGLFQGIAGIGYELLRVAFPERVPSILLWE
jgi:type 2 lantibiotic biosynthesis protein LanM